MKKKMEIRSNPMIQKKTKLMTMKKIIKRKYERKGSNSDDNDKENNKTKKNRKTSENHIKKVNAW